MRFDTMSTAYLKELAQRPSLDAAERDAVAAELEHRAELMRGQTADPAMTGQPVVVTDIDMPFGSMVGFMVKWAIASIPAFLILGALGFVLALLIGGLLAALGMSLPG
jgi:hypothetical protein